MAGQISISVDGTLVPKSGTRTFGRSVSPDDEDAQRSAYAEARAFLEECEAELGDGPKIGLATNEPREGVVPLGETATLDVDARDRKGRR